MAASALPWRTHASPGVAALHARQPHAARALPTARGASGLRVYASAFINPHQLLGVSATADVKEVKRAYRKLALQWHPDVCSSSDGHERFMQLTQAYEMLLGRAEGKTDPHHASASGWDFHDWYHSFRMRRSWEKQQRRAAAAAAEGHGASGGGGSGGGGLGSDADASAGRRPPPNTHAGYKQPEGRANLRSQLAGLRHRAAVRANRPAQPSSPSAAAAAAAAATASAASGCSGDWDDEGFCGGGGAAAVPPTQAWAPGGPTGSAASAPASPAEGSAAQGSGPRGAAWSWSWTWDTLDGGTDDEDEAAAAAAAAASAAGGAGAVAAAAADAAAAAVEARETMEQLQGQFTHVYDATSRRTMAVQDGALGTVVANNTVPWGGAAAAAATPVRRPSSAQGYQGQAQGAAADAAHGSAPAGQPPQQHEPSQQQQQQQRRVQLQERPLDAEDEVAAENEPFSSPAQQAQQQQQQARTGAGTGASSSSSSARRRFVADSATRESVSHQLTGLRRKAAIKEALAVQ